MDEYTELDALFDANMASASGLAAAYQVLLGGVPTVAGFTTLINENIDTNFGSNNPDVEFNDENIFINVTNALVQGNDTAPGRFDELTGSATTLEGQIAALYEALVPESAQTEDGLAYLTRPEALQFYQDVAEERGVQGEDGAAIVALASLLKILVAQDLGVGGDVNDLLAAVDDGSAELPQDGPDFTDIEIANGTNFDDDDDGEFAVTFTGADTNADGIADGMSPVSTPTAGAENIAVSNSTVFGEVSEIGDVSRFSISNQGASVGFGGVTAQAVMLSLTNVVDPDLDLTNTDPTQRVLDLVTIDFDDLTTTDFNVNVEDSAVALGLANASAGAPLGDDTLETLAINSTGDGALGNVVGVSGTSNLTSITVTGDADLILAGGTVIGGEGRDPRNGIEVSGGEFNPDTGFTAVESLTATAFTGNLTASLSNSTVNTTVRGGSGDDDLTTGSGDDLLVGGAGNDTLTGGAGLDIFGGGAGNDTQFGGAGNDEFHFDAGTGSDTIILFAGAGLPGGDVISFLDNNGAIDFANSTEDDVRGDSDLDAADYVERATITAITADDDQKVIEIQASLGAMDNDIDTAVGAAVEAYIVVDDGQSSLVYYDSDWSDTDERELIVTITGVADASVLTAADFDVY